MNEKVNWFGYARVSTQAQNLDEQILELKKAGVQPDHIFSEKYTGTTVKRKEFQKLMDILRVGDTLVVTKLDRLARNTREALNVIDALEKKHVTVRVLNAMGEVLDTSTPVGKLLQVALLMVADFERDLILERTQAGKEYAKKYNPNYKEGRPRRKIGEHERAIYEFYQNHGAKTTARAFKISVRTVYRIRKQILEESAEADVY